MKQYDDSLKQQDIRELDRVKRGDMPAKTWIDRSERRAAARERRIHVDESSYVEDAYLVPSFGINDGTPMMSLIPRWYIEKILSERFFHYCQESTSRRGRTSDSRQQFERALDFPLNAPMSRYWADRLNREMNQKGLQYVMRNSNTKKG